MPARLIIAPEAAEDVQQAYLWYESRRLGLGEEFLSTVDACIQAVCRMPDAHEKIHDGYRRALLRRFPYAVFYEFAAEIVTVYCVFHTSRDPDKWRERLV